MSLPLKGGGTISDRSSQPKLPYLVLGFSIPSQREHSANGMPVQGHLKCAFCSRALPSSVMLYTGHSDCSQPLPACSCDAQVYTERLHCLVEGAELSLNTKAEVQ